MPATTPASTHDNPNALPAGTRLGEFELRSLLGVGGFGIVYLAFDHALEREVAVKEYMPASLAGRTATMYVSLRSQSDAETFALGLKSFVNEARLLARFDHPSLLKVYRFWEANGTAYMAMPVLKGQTVKEVRMQMQGAPEEAWLRALLTPLLGAIENLHAEGVFHRDIAPDNIQVEPDGRPVLLDFGAARRVISDKTQSLTAILKPAYAPIEQYAEVGAVKQGPWTDIYALGATLHYLLLGRPPAPATARAIHDEATALTAANIPACSENFLAIVNWMLAPRPGDRPQSVAALRAALQGQTTPPAPRPNVIEAGDWAATMVLPRNAPAPRSEVEVDLDAAAGATPPAPSRPEREGQGVTAVMPPKPAQHPAAAASPAAHTSPPAIEPPVAKRRSRVLPAAVAAATVAALALGVAMWPRQPLPLAQADNAASAASAVLTQPAASSPLAEAPAASAPAVIQAQAETAVPVASAPAAEPVAVADPSPATVPRVLPAPSSRKAAATPGKPTATATKTEVAPPPATGGAVTTSAGPPPMSRPPPVEEGTPVRQQPPPGQSEIAKPAAAAPVATQAATPSAITPAPDTPRPSGSGPEATCGGRRPVLYYVCMERECRKPAFTAHAECVNWRKNARRE